MHLAVHKGVCPQTLAETHKLVAGTIILRQYMKDKMIVSTVFFQTLHQKAIFRSINRRDVGFAQHLPQINFYSPGYGGNRDIVIGSFKGIFGVVPYPVNQEKQPDNDGGKRYGEPMVQFI